MGLKVSGAPFTVAKYMTSAEPGWVNPVITDIRFNWDEKWKRWNIFIPGAFPFRGTTASPSGKIII